MLDKIQLWLISDSFYFWLLCTWNFSCPSLRKCVFLFIQLYVWASLCRVWRWSGKFQSDIMVFLYKHYLWHHSEFGANSGPLCNLHWCRKSNRIVRTAEKIIGASLPPLLDIYNQGCSITKDSSLIPPTAFSPLWNRGKGTEASAPEQQDCLTVSSPKQSGSWTWKIDELPLKWLKWSTCTLLLFDS